mmetsp:Transcript_29114/g.21658  ORF Transcript_29114/g.21658 Transcript_29114/m.21658 type:complete len:83 (-) Transcript_29114:60-308(-)
MVFAGQDAWRKHPLIYQCYKKPFPGLGTATAIFGTYLLLDWIFSSLNPPHSTNHHPTPSVVYQHSNNLSEMPTVKIQKRGHH